MKSSFGNEVREKELRECLTDDVEFKKYSLVGHDCCEKNSVNARETVKTKNDQVPNLGQPMKDTSGKEVAEIHACRFVRKMPPGWF